MSSSTSVDVGDEAEGAGEPFTRAAERDIAERIFAAVMDRRLPPGAKLSELSLCEAFETTRAHVRRALLVLSERGVVELRSNRGAFVASPTREEARNVFLARCVVEPPIMRSAVQRLTDLQIDHLARHVESEHAAERTRDRREMIRLSGLFHVTLASYAGNPVLTRIVEDLVARSSLIIGLFGDNRQENCSHDEHERLLAVLRSRDAQRAPGMMTEHLNAIERSLNLAGAHDEKVDLQKILGR